MTPEKLILVYNADDGLINALFDWAHKFFSPETYQCNLCRFTYGLRGMRYPWREFLESLGCETVFLHRGQFREIYPVLGISLPAILVLVDGRAKVLLAADEIAAAGSLDGLIQATRRSLQQLDRALAA